MIKQKTVSILGDDFLLTSYPATKGIRFQKELGKVLLPAFSEMNRQSGTTDITSMSLVLDKIAENLDKINETTLKEMVVLGASKGGVEINFDFEFSADYAKLYLLLKELVEFNFSSLFTVLGSEESPQ